MSQPQEETNESSSAALPSLNSTGEEEEKQVEKKEPVTEDTKPKKKVKPPPKPVRSLTDTEYEEIFEAAISRVMNAPLEEECEKEDTKDDVDVVSEASCQCDVGGENEKAETDDIKPKDKQTKTTTAASKKASSKPKVGDTKNKDAPGDIKEPSQKVQPKILPAFQKKVKETKTELNEPKPQKAEKENTTPKETHKRKIEEGAFPDKVRQPKEAKKTKLVKTKRTSSKEIMSQREVEEIGIWVQCSTASCNKWRHLKDVHDPTLLPEVWTCNMNTDPEQNSCDAKEAEYDPMTELEDFIHIKYAEGSLVWARMAGYPWWPGLVEVDPDYQIFFECRAKPNVASHYHVVFLDEKVTRAWFGIKALRPFTGVEENKSSSKARGQDFRKTIAEAKGRAHQALKLTLPERISQFGFASRFNGKWGVLKDDESLEEGSQVGPAVVEREVIGEDGFGSLSEQEVDNILDNTEAMIESAHQTLIELLSQQDEDELGSEEVPKKAKKRKTEKQAKKKEADATLSDKLPTKAKKRKTVKESTKAGEDESSAPVETVKTAPTKPKKTAPKSKGAKEKKVAEPVKPTMKPTKPKPFVPVKKTPASTANKPVETVSTESENSSQQDKLPEKTSNLEKTIQKIKGEASATVSEPVKESVVATATTEPAVSVVKEKTTPAIKKETVKKVKSKFFAPVMTKVQKEAPKEEAKKETQPKEKDAGQVKPASDSQDSEQEKLTLTPVDLDPLNLEDIDPLNLDLDLNVNLPSEAPAAEAKMNTTETADDSDAGSANFEE